MSMPCLTAVESSWTHEPTIARDRDGRKIGAPYLFAESRRKAKAERALIAAVDVSARPIDRERHAPDIADLGQILDVNAHRAVRRGSPAGSRIAAEIVGELEAIGR
jgi:hypothetical protein